MSMTKTIYSAVLPELFGPMVTLIEDPAKFVKHAADSGALFDYDAMKPDKNHVGIHLVGLGDVETFGFNRNGDGFPKDACIKYHDTFVKHGAVYRHHKHTDRNLSIGDIKASAYNPDMHRVELYIHADKEKAAPELKKLAEEGEIPFSMSCTPDPDYPVLTVAGYKRIIDIQIGDLVFTHNGNWKSVTELIRRKYTGEIKKFNVYGLSLPLELTSEHPMLVESVTRGGDKNRIQSVEIQKDWVQASEIKPGDFFYYRVTDKIPGYGAIADAGLAKLMGYFTAEGSFGYNELNPCTIVLTCNVRDEFLRTVPAFIHETWPGITVNIRPHKLSKACMIMEIFSTDLALYLQRFIGSGSKTKIICPELFNSSDDIKLAFLAAWLDGDGFIDNKGIHWSTVNPGLALQGRDLLLSMGISASIYRIAHEARDIAGNGTVSPEYVEYTLNMPLREGFRLKPHSSVVTGYLADETNYMPEQARATTMTRCEDDSLFYQYRIKAVELRTVVDLDVYNFEVADDHSYSFAGLLSHNCRVPGDRCGRCNTFRTGPKDPNQCDHIKYALGRMEDDGRVNGVYNDDPKFFDMSFVIKPADRTAWSLKVAAADITKISSVALAEMESMYVPHEIMLDSKSALAKYTIGTKIAEYENRFRKIAAVGPVGHEERALWEIRKSAAIQAIPDNVIEQLRQFDPQDAFYALAANSIIMDPVSYVKYAMGVNMGSLAPHIADIKKACAGACSYFLESKELYDICNESTYDVTDYLKFGDYGRNLAVKTAEAARSSGSLDPDLARERTIMNTIDQVPMTVVFIKKSEENNNSPLATCVARKYIAYKLAAADAMQALNKQVNEQHFALMAVGNIVNAN